jgi:hypothetical protein
MRTASVKFTIHQTPLGVPVSGTAVFDIRSTKVKFPDDAGIGNDAAWNAAIQEFCTLDIRHNRKHFVVLQDGEWVKDWRRVLLAPSLAKRADCTNKDGSIVHGYYLWNVAEQAEGYGLYPDTGLVHQLKTA